MRAADRVRRGRCRPGIAMLEVVVGLSLLTVAGAALLALLSQTMDAVERRYQHEAATRAASWRMDAIALWSRSQLDARVGSTPLGAWTLRITPLGPTLYRVGLADTATGAAVLETSLYRPDPDR